MSYKIPTLTLKTINFMNKDYLLIKEIDPNQNDEQYKENWIYIDLQGFWMNKEGLNLYIGNYIGKLYTLTGYDLNIINNYISKIKQHLSFDI